MPHLAPHEYVVVADGNHIQVSGISTDFTMTMLKGINVLVQLFCCSSDARRTDHPVWAWWDLSAGAAGETDYVQQQTAVKCFQFDRTECSVFPLWSDCCKSRRSDPIFAREVGTTDCGPWRSEGCYPLCCDRLVLCCCFLVHLCSSRFLELWCIWVQRPCWKHSFNTLAFLSFWNKSNCYDSAALHDTSAAL